MCLDCSALCQELSHALLGISLGKSHFSFMLASGWNLVSGPSHSVVEMLGNWFSKCFLHCAGLWMEGSWCSAVVQSRGEKSGLVTCCASQVLHCHP